MARIDIKRDPDEIDLPALTELLDAAGEADAHSALGEHAWLDLVQGGRAGFAALVAWEQDHPHPVGYAQLNLGQHDTGRPGEVSWDLEVVVDPHHRTPGNTVMEDLVRTAISVIASEGGGHLHLWVNQPRPYHDRLAEKVGLSQGRALYQMRRHLPLEEHATITTRPFRVGEDEKAWLELNNAAFAWHPEQGGWTEETLRAREKQDWFDPDGFLLYEGPSEPGGQDAPEVPHLAGFCWTKIHRDGHAPIGEIYVVAVAPGYTGRGLGRELVLAGLDYFAGLGIAQAMLYVDADNSRAVGLYVALGFAVNHIDRAYTGDISTAAGNSSATGSR